MKLVVLAGLLCCAVAQADRYEVEDKHLLAISSPDATVAYVVDHEIAEAMLEHGVITVRGSYPGLTHLVVISWDGVKTHEIVVLPSRRFESQRRAAQQLQYDATSNGWLRTQYSSQGQQIVNQLNMVHKSNDLETRLFFSTLIYAYPPAIDYAGVAPSRFILGGLSYDIRTPERRITILDQDVKESPLTIYSSTVRGLHVEDRGWFFHAGYTSPSVLQNLFLPALREGVWGGGYLLRLNHASSLTFSAYRLTSPKNDLSARPGMLFSTQYRYHPNDNVLFTAEVGLSRSVAASSELEYSREGEKLHARFRYSSDDFVALSTNRFPGVNTDANWSRPLNDRWSIDSFFYANRINVGMTQSAAVSGGGHVRFKASRRWWLNGGIAGSRYASLASSPVLGTSFPLGAQFVVGRLATGVDYQWSNLANNDRGGQLIRASMSESVGPIRFSAYGLRQTQAPTVQYILSQIPGLQQVLLEQGLTATTPQQINDFLQNNSALINLGYLQNVRVNVTPLQLQTGGSVAWHGSGRKPDITYDFLYSEDQALNHSVQNVIHRLSYIQRLTREADLQVSWSHYSSRTSGTGTVADSVLTAALRQQFRRAPAFITRERRGTISGQAFTDPENRRVFQAGAAGVAGVEVTLDGGKRVQTGTDGKFRFANVSEGPHQIQAQLRDRTANYFTTPADVGTAENTTVYFGVSRRLGTVIGRVVNDAGKGVGNAIIVLRRGARTINAETTTDGKFIMSGVEYGEYQAGIDFNALPPGYMRENLPEQMVVVTQSAAAQASFRLIALRSVAGRVMGRDRETKIPIPVAGVKVYLKELAKKTVTDSQGRYIFRNLPSGAYTFAVMEGDQEDEQRVTVPEDPAQIANINLNVGER